MSHMTYEHALHLFRKGQLREVIESLKPSGPWRESSQNERVLLAYALALAGDTSLAASVVNVEGQLTANIRSLLEATLGIISWRSGDADSAWKHLNLAV